MITLTEKQLLEQFDEDTRLEREFYNINATFKRRHFKKALRKRAAGKMLTQNEWSYVHPDYRLRMVRHEDGDVTYELTERYPETDMDGSTFYPGPEDGGMGYPEPHGGFPEFSEYAEPEITAADWRRE